MQTLAVISVAVLILSALLVAVFKGSHPPQPIPPTPTSPKQAVYAALMSVVCAAVLLVTLTRLGPSESVQCCPLGSEVLQVKTPRFVQRTIFVTCDGAWTTIKNVEHEEPPEGRL